MSKQFLINLKGEKNPLCIWTFIHKLFTKFQTCHVILKSTDCWVNVPIKKNCSFISSTERKYLTEIPFFLIWRKRNYNKKNQFVFLSIHFGNNVESKLVSMSLKRNILSFCLFYSLVIKSKNCFFLNEESMLFPM